jgi:20S proteasome alpha/beta subunit
VTVGIGAVCVGGQAAVVAADRMVTYGPPMSLQIEPPIKKIRKLDDSSVLVFAGSVPDGEDVATQALLAIRAMNKPQISAVAEAARLAYESVKRKRVEDAILKPLLGVNFTQFQTMAAQAAASQIMAQVLGMIMGHNLQLEVIVAGIDETGARLFAITNPGVLLPMQTTGFAAVGTGGTHAAVRLCLGQQSPDVKLPETMYNVYEAKLASEVAPGVGRLTDMVVLTTKGVTFISEQELKTLADFHKKEPGLSTDELSKLRAICKAYEDAPQSE